MQDYAKYNLWANLKICKAVADLTDAQLDEEHESSFNTVRKTIAHIVGAENLWLQRLILSPNPQWNDYGFLPINQMCRTWLSESEALIAYVQNLPEHSFTENISFNSLKGLPFQHTRKDCILHVCNHSTYHRGQVVTLLRQVGNSKVPGTDYILFKREEK